MSNPAIEHLANLDDLVGKPLRLFQVFRRKSTLPGPAPWQWNVIAADLTSGDRVTFVTNQEPIGGQLDVLRRNHLLPTDMTITSAQSAADPATTRYTIAPYRASA